MVDVVVCWNTRGLYLHMPHDRSPLWLQCSEDCSAAPQSHWHSVSTVIFTSSLMPCILIRNVWGSSRHAVAFKRTWNVIYKSRKKNKTSSFLSDATYVSWFLIIQMTPLMEVLTFSCLMPWHSPFSLHSLAAWLSLHFDL